MGIKKAAQRHWIETPLYFEAARARRRGKRAPTGAYRIVVPFRTYKVYGEHLLGIVDALQSLGRTAILHPVKHFREVGVLRPGDRVLAFAPYRLEPFDRVDGVVYAAVNSEQYPDDPAGLAEGLHARGAGFLGGCDLVFECHEALFDRAQALDLDPAGVLPFAYTERWAWRATPTAPRHDVAFLGRFAGDRRKELWSEIREQFNVNPKNEAWGRGRAHFLRSAKIQLSFSQTEQAQLAGHRFAMALANKCFIVSEPLPPGVPFKPGFHHVEATASSMVATIERYLENDDDRKRIAEGGHRFFTTEYRLEPFVQRLVARMDLAAEGR